MLKIIRSTYTKPFWWILLFKINETKLRILTAAKNCQYLKISSLSSVYTSHKMTKTGSKLPCRIVSFSMAKLIHKTQLTQSYSMTQSKKITDAKSISISSSPSLFMLHYFLSQFFWELLTFGSSSKIFLTGSKYSFYLNSGLFRWS